MRLRDWAGTVLVACLIAAAGLLHDHTFLLVGLSVVAVVCVVLIAWDVRRSHGGDHHQQPELGWADRGRALAAYEAEQEQRIAALELERLRSEMGSRSVIVETGTENPQGVFNRNTVARQRKGHLVDAGTRPVLVRVSSGEQKVPFAPVEIRETPVTINIGYGGTVTVRSFEDQGVLVDEANALPKQGIRYELFSKGAAAAASPPVKQRKGERRAPPPPTRHGTRD